MWQCEGITRDQARRGIADRRESDPARQGVPVMPRRWGRSARALLAAASVVGLIGATAVAIPGSAVAASTPGVVIPTCAWRINPNIATNNTDFVDSNASYWIMPYKVQAGVSIVLHGVYEDARYEAITIYDRHTQGFTVNGVFSGLTDFQIAPDAGSANPWQQNVSAGGRYTVTLSSDAPDLSRNILPIAPPGTPVGSLGWLFYRVYRPAGGQSAIHLPTVTFMKDGVSTPVPSCPAVAPTVKSGPATTSAAAALTAAVATPTITRQFARDASTTSGIGLPNPDNGYLTAIVRPPGGTNVVVMRAKAPVTPVGDHPMIWPSAAQIPYWSLCLYLPVPPVPVVTNKLPDGSTDVGCRADQDIAVDPSGYFTLVLGTEAQRAAIEAIPGATFIPFSTKRPGLWHMLLVRNLVPNFPQAVQNIPGDHLPATAESVMGVYYPRLAVCGLSTLAAGGPRACVATP
jgi:hypothetical protein